MTVNHKVWDFPAMPVSGQLFRVPGMAFEGGFTSGGARITSPEPGGRAVLEVQLSYQVSEWNYPLASWLMSKANGEIFRCRLTKTPQLVSNKSARLRDYARTGNFQTGTYTLNGQPITFEDATNFARSSVGSYWNSAGLLIIGANDVARFDHDPATLALKGLLIEAFCFNSMGWSQDFTQWTASNASVTSNSTVAPDGTTTADTITDANAVASGVVVKGSNLYYVFAVASIFVKKDAVGRATRFCSMILQYLGGTTQTNRINLDTATGEFQVVSGGSNILASGVQDCGSYWRLYIACQDTGGNSSISQYFYPAAGASSTWVLASSTTGSAIVWGAQLENNTIMSSYIPTLSNATVNRSADSLTLVNNRRNNYVLNWLTGSPTTVLDDTGDYVYAPAASSSRHLVSYTATRIFIDIPSGYLPWAGVGVGPELPWDNDENWYDDGIYALVSVAALEGQTQVTIDMGDYGEILKHGHCVGFGDNCYMINDIDYVDGIATLQITPPLRRDVAIGVNCWLRPFFLGTISNGEEFKAMYNAADVGNIQLGRIILNEVNIHND